MSTDLLAKHTSEKYDSCLEICVSVHNRYSFSSVLHFPGLVEEIKRLKKEGVRVLTYITPNLHSEGSLFKVAEEKGFLLKDKQGKTYLQDFMEFHCGTVDLTNPESFEWYKGRRGDLLSVV